MLQEVVDWVFYSASGLDSGSKAAVALNFFIYDSIKILFLIFLMIAVVSFLRSYIPHQRITKWISGRGVFGNVLAASFGALTPFCSCSSIPIFLGFVKAGVPLGVAFSFLITSPIVNEYLAVLMLGFFGWKITVAYVTSGILLGVFSGLILGKLGLEHYLDRDIASSVRISKAVYRNLKERIAFGLHEALDMTRKIWLWVLLGVGLGALIHNYIPQELILSVVNKTGIFSVVLATLAGIPIYGSCAAIVPIAIVLFQKGMPLGVVLSFMMSISALSLPEAVILRRAMKLPLIMIFFSIVAVGIMFTGYLFNILQPLLV